MTEAGELCDEGVLWDSAGTRLTNGTAACSFCRGRDEVATALPERTACLRMTLDMDWNGNGRIEAPGEALWREYARGVLEGDVDRNGWSLSDDCYFRTEPEPELRWLRAPYGISLGSWMLSGRAENGSVVEVQVDFLTCIQPVDSDSPAFAERRRIWESMECASEDFGWFGAREFEVIDGASSVVVDWHPPSDSLEFDRTPGESLEAFTGRVVTGIQAESDFEVEYLPGTHTFVLVRAPNGALDPSFPSVSGTDSRDVAMGGARCMAAGRAGVEWYGLRVRAPGAEASDSQVLLVGETSMLRLASPSHAFPHTDSNDFNALVFPDWDYPRYEHASLFDLWYGVPVGYEDLDCDFELQSSEPLGKLCTLD